MKSCLDVDKIYVLCLICAMAQLVDSRDEGREIKETHLAALPNHVGFRGVDSLEVWTSIDWG